MNTRGDISINMIILAVLALFALIILSFILTSKGSMFNKGISGCENKGGTCVTSGTCESGYGGIVTDFTCQSGQECCLSPCARRGGSCVPEQQCAGEQVYLAGCGEGYVCCK